MNSREVLSLTRFPHEHWTKYCIGSNHCGKVTVYSLVLLSHIVYNCIQLWNLDMYLSFSFQIQNTTLRPIFVCILWRGGCFIIRNPVWTLLTGWKRRTCHLFKQIYILQTTWYLSSAFLYGTHRCAVVHCVDLWLIASKIRCINWLYVYKLCLLLGCDWCVFVDVAVTTYRSTLKLFHLQEVWRWHEFYYIFKSFVLIGYSNASCDGVWCNEPITNSVRTAAGPRRFISCIQLWICIMICK